MVDWFIMIVANSYRFGPRFELKTHTALGSAEIGPFFMMWNFRIAAVLLVIADASEIAILPNAKLDTCRNKKN